MNHIGLKALTAQGEDDGNVLRTKSIHHLMFAVTFFCRLFCLAMGAYYLSYFQQCEWKVETLTYEFPENSKTFVTAKWIPYVEKPITGLCETMNCSSQECFLEDKTSSWTRWINNVVCFEIAAMAIGMIAMLGSLICVPEEKPQQFSYQVTSGIIMLVNVICWLVILVLIIESTPYVTAVSMDPLVFLQRYFVWLYSETKKSYEASRETYRMANTTTLPAFPPPKDVMIKLLQLYTPIETTLARDERFYNVSLPFMYQNPTNIAVPILAVCLTPLLYYCPSAEYVDIVRREFVW